MTTIEQVITLELDIVDSLVEEWALLSIALKVSKSNLKPDAYETVKQWEQKIDKQVKQLIKLRREQFDETDNGTHNPDQAGSSAGEDTIAGLRSADRSGQADQGSHTRPDQDRPADRGQLAFAFVV